VRTFLICWAPCLFVLLQVSAAVADTDPPLPSSGFNGDRYSTLWTKSPFAIATPEAAAATQDYQLVGLAQFDGVSYASLIDKQTQEHFIVTSEKPVKNLTLISVQHDSHGGSAVIGRNGEQLVLHEEDAPPTTASIQPPGPGPVPGGLTFGAPNGPRPSSNPSVGGMISPAFNPPPRVRIHRPLIIVPPPPSNPN
jgi:hypothetical protein